MFSSSAAIRPPTQPTTLTPAPSPSGLGGSAGTAAAPAQRLPYWGFPRSPGRTPVPALRSGDGAAAVGWRPVLASVPRPETPPPSQKRLGWASRALSPSLHEDWGLGFFARVRESSFHQANTSLRSATEFNSPPDSSSDNLPAPPRRRLGTLMETLKSLYK